MMNHTVPVGPVQPPIHISHDAQGLSRRQQAYHNQQYHPQSPHSPIHPYYPHPYQNGYYPQRPPPQPQFWPPHPQQPLYVQPQPPAAPYQGPVVVSSTGPRPQQQFTRSQYPYPRPQPFTPQLQRPMPTTSGSYVLQTAQTPLAPPSPALTPKQESSAQDPTIRSEDGHEPGPSTPLDASVGRATPETSPSRAPQSMFVGTFNVEASSAVPRHAPSTRASQSPHPLSLPPEHKTPFYPNLPWYSVKEQSFPPRAVPRRRRQKSKLAADTVAIAGYQSTVEDEKEPTITDDTHSEISTVPGPSDAETPATSQPPSESDYTQVSTPATPAQAALPSPKATPTQSQPQPQPQSQIHARRDTRTAIAIPNIPGLPKPKSSTPLSADKASSTVLPPSTEVTTPTPEDHAATAQSAKDDEAAAQSITSDEQSTPQTPPPKQAPKSWADMARKAAGPGGAVTQSSSAPVIDGASLPKTATLAEALRQYSVNGGALIPFLEPRGLVNTGNMCYMNSILQVLVYCTPFYHFLDQVRQRTVHSMKSNTPLLDASIMYMREFKVLASAESASALRKVLKQEQLDQFGEPVTPEYVYDAIRALPRFQSMRRGHQQDAEEFLGFLLEELHDECVSVMRSAVDDKALADSAQSNDVIESPRTGDGWFEVGPKQKASVTRTAGETDAPTPITKIFGGHLRSELRVPGLKDSVTLEPYKPLQLDIGAQHVSNIVDALKGLTKTEVLTGDFGGRGSTAKKQVFIEDLPPVLILHLKRFQYENNLTGTQKIWKKIGYPLELEIPKEVFAPSRRAGLAVKGGLPKYRLLSVVYHHGKSAAGGHYTVDVLRQDGREWVRIDDTVIRRIRPEDVAEGGAEEDPKLLAKALEQHKADQELQKQRNMYQGLDDADESPSEDAPWSQVNGHIGHKRQQLSVANTNGTATPTSTAGKRTPTARKEGVKDNKVAYILLYERISS